MRDDVTRAGEPARLVDEYLQLCEDRQLEEAGGFLAPDARLFFPGGRVFRSLPEMAASAGRRYRWVRKRRERYFVGNAGDATTVTSLGTLYGEDLDGNAFDSIRYADVLVIRDDRIVEQHVYNDIGLMNSGAEER